MATSFSKKMAWGGSRLCESWANSPIFARFGRAVGVAKTSATSFWRQQWEPTTTGRSPRNRRAKGGGNHGRGTEAFPLVGRGLARGVERLLTRGVSLLKLRESQLSEHGVQPELARLAKRLEKSYEENIIQNSGTLYDPFTAVALAVEHKL